MADSTTLSEQPIVDFRTKCTIWLEKAEQQKMRAIEMSELAHQMSDLAAEMRKRPNPTSYLGDDSDSRILSACCVRRHYPIFGDMT